MIRISDGESAVAIEVDPYLMPFTASDSATAFSPADRRSQVLRSATVDIFRAVGGVPERALLGGINTPTDVLRIAVNVPTSGRFLMRPGKAGRALLRGDLVPGLPDVLARPVLVGLLSHSTGSGDMTVTSAGYDIEKSSYSAFVTGARVLSIALHSDHDLRSDEFAGEVRAVLRSQRADHLR